jgi:hypothetical protein
LYEQTGLRVWCKLLARLEPGSTPLYS